MATFAVSRTRRQLVEAHRPGIEEKFRVAVQLSSYAESTEHLDGVIDEADSCQPKPSVTGQESDQMWVEIRGATLGAAQAKEYILSLCNQGTDLKIIEKLPQGFGDLLANKLDNIAANTLARIERIGLTDNLTLYGDETSIACARSLIDEECNRLRRQLEYVPSHSYGEQYPSRIYQDSQTYGRIHSQSPQHDTPKERLDSEDNLSRFSPTRNIKEAQNSWTGSPDMVTNSSSEINNLQVQMGKTGQQSPRLISRSVSIKPPDIQPKDSQTVSVVSSMQKLGFSKEQVDLILNQLGPGADHNDVLGALVNQRPTKTDFEDVNDPKVEAETRKDMSDGYPIEDVEDDSNNLRPIIIDGSNVAMSFGNKDVFACKGIKVTVKWFVERGHRKIHVFVPAWRKEASKPDTPITDQEILNELESQNFLVWTPSRRINGRRIVCYDDRYILNTAVDEDGIIVSNDNFRDIQNEKPEWKKVIEERLLMYSFVSDRFMPPDDPLGRHGPSLDNFLRMKPTMPDHLPQACPYGKKCTYGNKCKYYHMDRPNRPMKSISETLKERDKNRKEMAKLSNERSNSPRFSTASTAPIPGYIPPEEVTSAPEWHTTPLPGTYNHQSQRKTGRVVSDSSPLQVSSPSARSGSPRHYYANEPIAQVPYQSSRDEVFRGQDSQRFHQNTGAQQSLSQVPPRHLNTPPLGRSGHTSPSPNYSQHSERANQQGMYTVPLQRFTGPNQPDRGYAQREESLNSKRLSMPAVMYGSGESLGVTPPGMNVERRSSHNDLIPDFRRLVMQESSGMQLPREQQHNYSYGQPPQQYHSGEQFPGQMHPLHHQADFTQGTNQPVPYHSAESFVPRHHSPSGMTSDQRMYTPPRHTSPPGYPTHEPSRQLYTPAASLPMAGATYRPSEPSKISPEEQRKQNIMNHLSGPFGRKKVEAVMQRHPNETNPQKLIGYMSTNT